MESYYDIENNRRLAIIEESINRTLLSKDIKEEKNNYSKFFLLMLTIFGLAFVGIIIVVILIVTKKISL